MIKQPIQPLKFYSSLLEVEKDWNDKDKGSPGTHIITEDILFLPPFQIKFDNRHEDITDFTFELISYDDGITTDITNRLRAVGVHTYGDYQNLVCYRFPLSLLNAPGNYYLKINDDYEVWYSEVFQLCDLNRNLCRSWMMSGWNWDTDVNVLTQSDCWVFQVCRTAPGTPYVSSGNFYVTKDEPLDLYLSGVNAGTCANTSFLHLNFVLHDGSGNDVSNVVVSIEGSMSARLIPTKTCEVNLYCYPDPVDYDRSGWYVYSFYANPMLHDGSHSDNIGARKVLRWSNPGNACDMVYEELIGYTKVGDDNRVWQMSYENYLILDNPPLIPDYAIVENVAEDDSSNKYLLLGNQQEWYYLQLGGNENLAKAIQNIHLMSLVELDYNGESHMICENASEISYNDDYNFTIRFRFRETTCPVQSCGFEVCCPNLLNVYTYQAPGLPACNTAGLRYISHVGGTNQLWQCDGANWIHMLDEEVDGACIYLEVYAGCHYWWWDSVEWTPFVTIDTVTDETGGIATITVEAGNLDGLYVQAEYSTDAGVTYTKCGNPVELTGGADAISCDCGAGVNIKFRLHVYTANTLTTSTVKCDYGYSNVITKTIT